MKSWKKMFAILILGVFFWAANPGSAFAAGTELVGAGATFPYPLYAKMFDVYFHKTGVKINYQAIGSGGGIRQLLSKTIDFGGTDAFMSDEEMQKTEEAVVHVPVCLGAVVVTYNLPGNPQLKFTPDVISGIFLGKIKKWNDPKIAAVNPGISLPSQPVVVVHRSDGSGTTFIFSDYLSKVSPEWEKKAGRGKSLNWPLGLGAKGNPGVAGLIKQITGSVGYVELTYALSNKMPVGIIQNKSCNFIVPSLSSVSLAAEVDLPSDTRVSITDTESGEGYPVSGFTWIILYKEQSYKNRSRSGAAELVKLLWWMVHEGQNLADPLHYAPLPEEAVRKAESILKSVTYNQRPLLGNEKIK